MLCWLGQGSALLLACTRPKHVCDTATTQETTEMAPDEIAGLLI
jgi:hypothetical protein